MSIHAKPIPQRDAMTLKRRMQRFRPDSDFDLITVTGTEFVFVKETDKDGMVTMHGDEQRHTRADARRALERFRQARRKAFEGRQSYFPGREV